MTFSASNEQHWRCHLKAPNLGLRLVAGGMPHPDIYSVTSGSAIARRSADMARRIATLPRRALTSKNRYCCVVAELVPEIITIPSALLSGAAATIV